METSTVLLGAYSVVLLAVAWGIHWQGTRAASGHDRGVEHDEQSDPVVGLPQWPHSEVPKLHSAIASVAAAGVVLLAVVEVLMLGPGASTIVFGAVAVCAIWTLSRLSRPLRRSAARRRVDQNISH